MSEKIQIPWESQESAKALVGKTLQTKDGRKVFIAKMEGTEYTVQMGDKQAQYQVMHIIGAIVREQMKVL